MSTETETILPCPGCKSIALVAGVGLITEFGPQTYSQVQCGQSDTGCGYKGPYGSDQDHAIRLHNLICRPQSAPDKGAEAVATDLERLAKGPVSVPDMAAMPPVLMGSSVCPICGLDQPHHHRPEVVSEYYAKVNSASMKQINGVMDAAHEINRLPVDNTWPTPDVIADVIARHLWPAFIEASGKHPAQAPVARDAEAAAREITVALNSEGYIESLSAWGGALIEQNIAAIIRKHCSPSLVSVPTLGPYKLDMAPDGESGIGCGFYIRDENGLIRLYSGNWDKGEYAWLRSFGDRVVSLLNGESVAAPQAIQEGNKP